MGNVQVNIDTEHIIAEVKKQVIAEFKHRCVIWFDVTGEATDELPPAFERVCNQDGEPVFLDSGGSWKSVVTGKKVDVSSWCEMPKRERC